MKPLLAHVYEPHRITFPCFIQPKLNGIRALYQDGFFQSRDELPWGQGILDHIGRELETLRLNSNVILDGELYVHGWPLQRINGAVTPVRVDTSRDTALVQYHIFDTVDFQQSFEARWNRLPHAIHLPHVYFVQTKLISSFNEADAFYKEKVDEGYEGVMYRLGRCPYTTPKQSMYIFKTDCATHHWPPPGRLKYWSDQDNRTWHLLKRKNWLDDEYTITGFALTTGEQGETGFQLTCVTKHGLYFNAGSGLSESERDYYAGVSPVGRQAKIKYLVLSSSGIPLNPTILAIL